MKTAIYTQTETTAFADKLQNHDWSWIENTESLKRYLNLLCLLNQQNTPLVPDVLADCVLHQHLSRPSFQQEMQSLFGRSLVHTPGATADGTLTRQLYEQTFGAVAEWQPADCSILLTA